MCDFLDFGLTFFLHYVNSGSFTITSKAKINVFSTFFEILRWPLQGHWVKKKSKNVDFSL